MAICEMCGEQGELVDSIVEGVTMNVCLSCAKFGHVIPINQPIVDKKIERKEEIDRTEDEMIDAVVDDYSERIKKAREKKGLKQEELAQAIAEKVSVIHQLESSNLKPSFRLAKKLAVFLNIDLVGSFEMNIKFKKDLNFKDKTLTIGDMLKDDGTQEEE
jgi:putative transcription factor